MVTNQGLFDRIDAPTSDVRSTVGHLAGLGPTTAATSGHYPPPWYYTWDSPVWRVMAQDRTMVATCTDEIAAKMICDLVMLVKDINR